MKHYYFFIFFLFVSSNIYAQATDFIIGLNNPQDIILDGNILYIAESDANRIIKVDLLLPNPTPEVVISGIPMLRGLALNGNELYFSQLNGQNKISKINLLDTNPTPTVILENFISAQDMVFYENELYIAQFGLDRIVKLDPSIPNPTIVEVITGFETPIALELVGDELYIATWAEDKISKIDLTNSNPVAINVITNLLLPVGLAHRGNELYIAEAGQSIGEDRISKIDITNPSRETVVSELYNPTKGLVIYDDVLYISEDIKISSFGLPPLLSTDNFDLEKISVYPNPTIDHLKVLGLTNPIGYIIYSLSGTILDTGVVSENNNNIDFHSLSSGTYFLVFEDSQIKKIVKK